MLDALDITEAEAAGLSELAALDLAMARSFAARAQAAEDPQVQNELARSYQRMARSYRQTLALKVRLKRDLEQSRRARGDRPAADPRVADPRVAERKAEVRQALERVAWNEYEPAEKLDAFDELEWFMEVEAHEPRFLADPLPVVVARLCRDLDVEPPKPEAGCGTEPPAALRPPTSPDEGGRWDSG